VPRRKKDAIPPPWWVERWLDTVARGGEQSRAQRGRGYARGGRVEDIVVEPGLIAARVQGTRPAPYRVEVRVPTFDEAAWRRAIGRLAEQSGTAAALLAGELPAAGEEAFHPLGLSLFPGPDERVAISCSCPDWERPCKHAMAVFHLIATRLETDPFVLFALRGRGRDELLAGLRAARAGTPADGEENDAPPVPTLAQELAGAIDRFWSLPPAEPASAPPSPPALRRLSPVPAALGGALLRQELATAYETLHERAERLARDRPAG
jgi:uncharacterized Zn finger protein